MKNIHDQLAAIQRHGASSYNETTLASSHRPVTRRVRRDRAVRGSVATLAGVGVAGAGTLGVLQLRAADALAPAGPSSPSVTGTASPTEITVEGSVPYEWDRSTVFKVEAGERAHVVIERLAQFYGATVEESRDGVALVLPAEAQGEPEGWLAVGEHATWDDDGATPRGSVTEQARALVTGIEQLLERNNVPREQWQKALTIASIAQAEAITNEDMAGIAAVVHNRLAQGMPLQMESPLQYYADSNVLELADDGWNIDTPFNTYMYEGLPPTPINSPSHHAIAAAANPADVDWLYFVANSDTGETLFATTFREHQENLVELGIIEPEDVV